MSEQSSAKDGAAPPPPAPLAKEDTSALQLVHGLAEKEGVVEAPTDIAIEGTKLLRLPDLTWKNYGNAPNRLVITNTGHTVNVGGKWESNRSYLRDGPFKGQYVFAQMHFHWGPGDDTGSEHSVDGVKLPMELHVVHINRIYRTQELALKENDGVAILIYLFQLQEQDNSDLSPLVDALPMVTLPQTSTTIDPMAIDKLIVPFQKDYFLYWGAVSSPTCKHRILWLTSRTPLGISSDQLAHFRQIRDVSGQFMVKNFRETHPRKSYTLFHVNPSSKVESTLLTPYPGHALAGENGSKRVSGEAGSDRRKASGGSGEQPRGGPGDGKEERYDNAPTDEGYKSLEGTVLQESSRQDGLSLDRVGDDDDVEGGAALECKASHAESICMEDVDEQHRRRFSLDVQDGGLERVSERASALERTSGLGGSGIDIHIVAPDGGEGQGDEGALATVLGDPNPPAASASATAGAPGGPAAASPSATAGVPGGPGPASPRSSAAAAVPGGPAAASPSAAATVPGGPAAVSPSAIPGVPGGPAPASPRSSTAATVPGGPAAASPSAAAATLGGPAAASPTTIAGVPGGPAPVSPRSSAAATVPGGPAAASPSAAAGTTAGGPAAGSPNAIAGAPGGPAPASPRSSAAAGVSGGPAAASPSAAATVPGGQVPGGPAVGSPSAIAGAPGGPTPASPRSSAAAAVSGGPAAASPSAAAGTTPGGPAAGSPSAVAGAPGGPAPASPRSSAAAGVSGGPGVPGGPGPATARPSGGPVPPGVPGPLGGNGSTTAEGTFKGVDSLPAGPGGRVDAEGAGFTGELDELGGADQGAALGGGPDLGAAFEGGVDLDAAMGGGVDLGNIAEEGTLPGGPVPATKGGSNLGPAYEGADTGASGGGAVSNAAFEGVAGVGADLSATAAVTGGPAAASPSAVPTVPGGPAAASPSAAAGTTTGGPAGGSPATGEAQPDGKVAPGTRSSVGGGNRTVSGVGSALGGAELGGAPIGGNIPEDFAVGSAAAEGAEGVGEQEGGQGGESGGHGGQHGGGHGGEYGGDTGGSGGGLGGEGGEFGGGQGGELGGAGGGQDGGEDGEEGGDRGWADATGDPELDEERPEEQEAIGGGPPPVGQSVSQTAGRPGSVAGSGRVSARGSTAAAGSAAGATAGSAAGAAAGSAAGAAAGTTAGTGSQRGSADGGECLSEKGSKSSKKSIKSKAESAAGEAWADAEGPPGIIEGEEAVEAVERELGAAPLTGEGGAAGERAEGAVSGGGEAQGQGGEAGEGVTSYPGHELPEPPPPPYTFQYFRPDLEEQNRGPQPVFFNSMAVTPAVLHSKASLNAFKPTTPCHGRALKIYEGEKFIWQVQEESRLYAEDQAIKYGDLREEEWDSIAYAAAQSRKEQRAPGPEVTGVGWPFDPFQSENPSLQLLSPIDVALQGIPEVKLSPLVYDGHFNPEVTVRLANTGATVEVRLLNPELTPTLHGGPLPDDYIFDSMHFHWGSGESADSLGSVHRVAGQRFCMEVHLLHYRAEFGSKAEALRHPGGLCAVAFLLHLTGIENAFFARLALELRKVETPMSCTPLDHNPLLCWAEAAAPFGYVTYPGTLIGREDNLNVVWIVYPNPVGICCEHTMQFQRLRPATDPVPGGVLATHEVSDRPVLKAVPP